MLARIPSWYSPWGHLVGTVGVGVVTLLLAAPEARLPERSRVLDRPDRVRVLELRRVVRASTLDAPPAPSARRALRPPHARAPSRLPLRPNGNRKPQRALVSVLIPALGVLGIVLLAVPVALAAGLAVSPNVGWLFLMTSAVYVVGYELSHLAYHLPESSFVYRLPLLRTLREHHARHHLPGLMQKANFNVTIPLGDFLFGTFASSKELDQRRGAQRRESETPSPERRCWRNRLQFLGVWLEPNSRDDGHDAAFGRGERRARRTSWRCTSRGRGLASRTHRWPWRAPCLRHR